MAKFIKIWCMAGLGLALLSLISCEQKQEPVKSAPKVVSKSIDLPKSKAPGPPSPKTAISGGAVKVEALQSKPPEKMSPGLSGDAKMKKAVDTAAVGTPLKQGPDLGSSQKAGATRETVKKTYDTKGRVDPFVPLFSEKKTASSGAPTREVRPKRMLTPLEKMDLNQFKLVAVVQMKGGSIAMVEEASGKGYEVRVGTYIGRNGGQVSAITQEGLEVKEYSKDFKGNRRERIQKIKFTKSEGGE